MRFSDFGKAVAAQFQAMTGQGLYRAAVSKDDLWDTYLNSFPEGTNPIFKERTEHDCQCCKSFIRAVGGAVSFKNGKLVTIWDVEVGGPYQIVADAMAELVRTAAVDNIFLSTERAAGVAKNFQQLLTGEVKTWEHFFVNFPNGFTVRGDEIGPKLSDARAAHDVLLRSLKELTLESVDTVLDLIAQGSLYRGSEHTFAVESFRGLKQSFGKLKTEQQQDFFAWTWSKASAAPVSRIRNTAIGTLLVDLSEGVDLETAVKSFERVVAPANYKRPTALVTPAMIKKAQETIVELELTSALERRYATIDDITVNNILFADRSAKKALGVLEEIIGEVPGRNGKGRSLDKVEEVKIEDFIANVLPRAESLEVMLENRHAGNLVSLVAPADPTAKNLFKWPNHFSWSYTGEVTDSIKERVKRAGGSVEGDLCCRLAWDYTDDLDFHMYEPGGSHIYFGNRRTKSLCGGELDLDANGADGLRADPAENIYYSTKQRMKEGVYTLKVHNYHRRSNGQGFEVEVECEGQTHRMVYEKALSSSQTVVVAEIQYTKAGGFKILNSLPSTQASKVVWGIPTETFRKVNVVMLSPNHWDNRPVGNKHYFFMLDGCLNEGKARGFFNEFLTEDLNTHRKVLELVGSKMKTEESDRQLSGLGFSSTQKNHVLCRVKGSFSRVVKVTF